MITLSSIAPTGFINGIEGHPQLIITQRVKIDEPAEVVGPAKVIILNGKGTARDLAGAFEGLEVEVNGLYSIGTEADAVEFTTTSNEAGITQEPYGLLLMIMRPA